MAFSSLFLLVHASALHLVDKKGRGAICHHLSRDVVPINFLITMSAADVVKGEGAESLSQLSQLHESEGGEGQCSPCK